MIKYRFVVYPEDRVVVCMGIDAEKEQVFIEKAQCHNYDKFDVEYGMKLSKIRCEMKVMRNAMNHAKHQVTKLNKKSKRLREEADAQKESSTWYEKKLKDLGADLELALSENS